MKNTRNNNPCAKNKSEPTIVFTTLRTTEQNYCFAVYVTDPVYLKVRHRHLEHKDKTVRFNISCNGRQVIFTTILFNTWVFCSQINSPGFTDLADPGEGPGTPLFLNQTEAWGAEKNFFWHRPPPPISGSWWPSPHLPSSKNLDLPLQT